MRSNVQGIDDGQFEPLQVDVHKHARRGGEDGGEPGGEDGGRQQARGAQSGWSLVLGNTLAHPPTYSSQVSHFSGLIIVITSILLRIENFGCNNEFICLADVCAQSRRSRSYRAQKIEGEKSEEAKSRRACSSVDPGCPTST